MKRAGEVKKILYAQILAFLILQVHLSAQERVISLVVLPDIHPVSYVNKSGEPDGLFTRLLEKFAENYDYELEYRVISWNEGYQAVVDGDVDLMPAIIKTEQREEVLDFMHNPVMTSWGQVFIRETNSFNSVLDLEGRRLGLMSGDQNAKNFTQLLNRFGIRCIQIVYSNHSEIEKDLVAGKIEAGVFFNSYRPVNSDIIPSSIIFNPVNSYFATAAGTNATLLLELSEQMLQWKEEPDSYYYRQLNQFFGTSVQSHRLNPVFIIISISLGILLLVALLWSISLKLAVRTITSELRDEKDFSDTVLDSQSDIFFLYDPESKKGKKWNSSFRTVTGYNDAEIANLPFPDEFFPENELPEINAMLDAVLSGSNGILTAELITSQGMSIPVECTFSVTHSLKEKKKYVIIIGRDITQRKIDEMNLKKSLLEKNTLLQELYHRTKNNMQVISSLLKLQAETVKSEELSGHLMVSVGRIESMALVHKKLYQSQNLTGVRLKEYVEDLISLISENYTDRRKNIRITSEVDDISVLIDIAVPVGLILNELITNCLKHAFPEDEGEIFVAIKQEDDENIHVCVNDNGIGVPAEPTIKESVSLGIQTVINIVEYQLSGDIQFSTDHGLSVCFKFRTDLYAPRV